jgi:hypothetical protein
MRRYYVVAKKDPRWYSRPYQPIRGPYATLNEARKVAEEIAKKIIGRGNSVVDVVVASRTWLASHGFPRNFWGDFFLNADLDAALDADLED